MYCFTVRRDRQSGKWTGGRASGRKREVKDKEDVAEREGGRGRERGERERGGEVIYLEH